MNQLDMSVVIGFRDWGGTRLGLAVNSVQRAFGRYHGEVILVDYGSADKSVAVDVAERTDAKLVQVASASEWSRSRALNAGFAVANGRLFVSTDADMLFGPTTLETIYEWWQHSGPSAMFLQCRDLPEEITLDDLDAQSLDWSYLESASSLRPRWGVGGMMAISKTQFRELRGFDERMATYGREDMDFALRARRLGLRMVWVEDKKARIYHMWHSPTVAEIQKDPKALSAVSLNRKIYSEDSTVVRNRVEWIHRGTEATPIVSAIVDASRTNSTEIVRMLLLQTIVDLEILIVNDDQGIVNKFADGRVRIVTENFINFRSLIDSSRGKYVLLLSNIEIIARDFVEAILKKVGGMTRVVFSGELSGPSCERSRMLADREQGLGACMFERDVLRNLSDSVDISEGIDYDVIVNILDENYILHGISEDSYFEGKNLRGNADPNESVKAENNSKIDRFWPFKIPQGSRIDVQLCGNDILSLEASRVDGDLTTTRLSVDDRDIDSRSLIRGASLADLLYAASHHLRISPVTDSTNLAHVGGDGFEWAATVLKEIGNPAGWIPYSAVFASAEVDSLAIEVASPSSIQSTIRRIQDDQIEEMTVVLTRDSVESKKLISTLSHHVKFVVAGDNRKVS